MHPPFAPSLRFGRTPTHRKSSRPLYRTNPPGARATRGIFHPCAEKPTANWEYNELPAVHPHASGVKARWGRPLLGQAPVPALGPPPSLRASASLRPCVFGPRPQPLQEKPSVSSFGSLAVETTLFVAFSIRCSLPTSTAVNGTKTGPVEENRSSLTSHRRQPLLAASQKTLGVFRNPKGLSHAPRPAPPPPSPLPSPFVVFSIRCSVPSLHPPFVAFRFADLDTVHLHTCGGSQIYHGGVTQRIRPPPRVWGKQNTHFICSPSPRSTPTRVGKTARGNMTS